MSSLDIFTARSRFARDRLDELRGHVSASTHAQNLSDLVVFTAGSYGRLEASSHSDIDLFFIYPRNASEVDHRKTKELRLFGDLIDIAERMQFPAFSNDGQYLHTVGCQELLTDLGSPADDAKNYFTLRLLMILESRPVLNDTGFETILADVFDSYYRDYPDHKTSWEPWFLLNDIARFWKTLLLNYENRRNQNGANTDKNKQKVKNFKLKFSRMTTCFATIAAIGANPRPVELDQLLQMVKLTPRERLLSAQEHVPSISEAVEEVLEDYAWFMQQTALSENDLLAKFEDKTSRVAMFDRADKYGDKMYRLIRKLDEGGPVESGGLMKHLVI